MSRRREEFAHRTSIFEGAYRAWSHLGGLELKVLQDQNFGPSDLDPLTYTIPNDERLSQKSPADPTRREYPHEPLPRSGLHHPFVQAVFPLWWGSDDSATDPEAVQLGLTSLRTWWQHRRRGESPSSIQALASDKMIRIVNEYTRYFFQLAYCLVVQDCEQPPRTLHLKAKSMQQKTGKKPFDSANYSREILERSTGATMSTLGEDLSALERIHHVQQEHKFDGSLGSLAEPASSSIVPLPAVQIKGKCMPGKLNLEGLAVAVSRKAEQLAFRGGGGGAALLAAPETCATDSEAKKHPVVVYSSADGTYRIGFTIKGVTCTHCQQIAETVLKGSSGQSSIDGILDAVVDGPLECMVIKIDSISNARRIASEAARNLALVGYKARVIDMDDHEHLATAIKEIGLQLPLTVIDWETECICGSQNGVPNKAACARHSQMGKGIFDAFEEQKVRLASFWETGVVDQVMSTKFEGNGTTLPVETPIQASSWSGADEEILESVLFGDTVEGFDQGFDNDAVDFEKTDALYFLDEDGNDPLVGEALFTSKPIADFPQSLSL